MVRLISVKCPDCGAALQFEEDRKTAFCSYCGAKILLHNENEYIYRSVDEAGLKQAENDRIYMAKRLEMEERENRHHRMLTFIWLFITIVMVVIGFVMVSGDPDDGNNPGYMLLVGAMLVGAYGGIGLMSDKDEDKKDANRSRPGFVKSPPEADNFMTMHYTAVESLFRANGFMNIRTINLGDLWLGILSRNGNVASVTIGGERFSPNKWYPREAPVIISYHGFRE